MVSPLQLWVIALSGFLNDLLWSLLSKRFLEKHPRWALSATWPSRKLDALGDWIYVRMPWLAVPIPLRIAFETAQGRAEARAAEVGREKRVPLMATFKDAIALAIERHRGQRDKNDRPSIPHPLGVLHRLDWAAPEAAKIAVVLHDVVEDTDVTLDDLQRQEFPKDAVIAIDLLMKK